MQSKMSREPSEADRKAFSEVCQGKQHWIVCLPDPRDLLLYLEAMVICDKLCWAMRRSGITAKSVGWIASDQYGFMVFYFPKADLSPEGMAKMMGHDGQGANMRMAENLVGQDIVHIPVGHYTEETIHEQFSRFVDFCESCGIPVNA